MIARTAARYLSAMLLVDVTEEQAEAILSAVTVEEAKEAWEALPPRPIYNRPKPKPPMPKRLPDLTDWGCTDILWRTGMERLSPRALGAQHD